MDDVLNDFRIYSYVNLEVWYMFCKVPRQGPAQDVPYCIDEISDHKLGIYCNLIGPLDQS